MIPAARTSRLIWPGLMTLVMLVVLLGLGTWQVQRMQWKQRILAEIAQAEASAPRKLPANPAPFDRVQVTGRLRPDLVALFGAEVRTLRTGPEMGARLITVLERAEDHPVLLDRGWVPLKQARSIDQPEGEVTINGFVHPGATASWFSARDDAAGRRFYTLDPAVISRSLGLRHAAPFVIVALGPTPEGGWPDPAKHLPRPPNNHLIYALTWYGFAVTLVVIFLVWARRVSRHDPRP
jgi:surfeit locus 1 family protein